MTVATAVRNQSREDRLDALRRVYGHLDGAELLRPMIEDEFTGRIALVSSFGAESAVLLHLVAEIDPALPVIFLNTGKLFGETLRYRDTLQARLGLMDIRVAFPDPREVAREDPGGMLFRENYDACCDLRKVRPLARALAGFEAWITGRKRYQTALRARIDTIEADSTHIKINPLASWTELQIEAYAKAHALPAHPLVNDGFLSIGCFTCTERVKPGGNPRDGRWADADKDECGIHIDGSGI